MLPKHVASPRLVRMFLFNIKSVFSKDISIAPAAHTERKKYSKAEKIRMKTTFR
jgi:hypothetical protein